MGIPFSFPLTRILVTITAAVVVLVVYMAIHELYYGEIYCPEHEFKKLVSLRALERVPANDLEKQRYSWGVGDDGKIYVGVRAQIQCEEAHRAFVYF
jgi:hypothetical protein